VEEVIRRVWPFLLFAVLIAAPTAAQDKRIIFPMEEFMPATAELYVSLPNGATAMAVLGRLGDSEEGLAGRIAKRSGAERKAVLERLRELVAATDGPVTVSRHRLKMPGEPERTELLVTLASKQRDDRLKKAALEFVRTTVARDRKVVGERIMDTTTLHFKGERDDLFFAEARGYIVVSTDPFILGRLLKELSGPSVNNLKYRPEFAGAAKMREETPDAGLFWVKKAALPTFAKRAGISVAFGRLVATENGYRDEALLWIEKNGLLRRLSKDGKIPLAWMDASTDGIWVGASLTKAGVLNLAISVLHPDHALNAMRLDSVATGGVEFLWRPGKVPAMAVATDSGAEREKATRPLAGLAATRADGAIVISEDIDAAESLLKAKAKAQPGYEGGARLAAGVPALLRLFGRAGAPGKRRTKWLLESEEDAVRITCGLAEVGPVQAIVGAFLP
jgi:hypothetical protein